MPSDTILEKRPKAAALTVFLILTTTLLYGAELGNLGLIVAIIAVGMSLVFLYYVHRFVTAVETLASAS